VLKFPPQGIRNPHFALRRAVLPERRTGATLFAKRGSGSPLTNKFKRSQSSSPGQRVHARRNERSDPRPARVRGINLGRS